MLVFYNVAILLTLSVAKEKQGEKNDDDDDVVDDCDQLIKLM